MHEVKIHGHEMEALPPKEPQCLSAFGWPVVTGAVCGDFSPGQAAEFAKHLRGSLRCAPLEAQKVCTPQKTNKS